MRMILTTKPDTDVVTIGGVTFQTDDIRIAKKHKNSEGRYDYLVLYIGGHSAYMNRHSGTVYVPAEYQFCKVLSVNELTMEVESIMVVNVRMPREAVSKR